MITKIVAEQPFQILGSSFSISPSSNAYTLQISADGENYSDLFNVAANTTRMITGVSAGSFYKLKGNTDEVSVNWRKDCGGDDGTAMEIKPMQSLPLTADEGSVVATVGGVFQFKNGAWKKIEGGGGTGGTEYTAGANIDISADDVISVTGITSYTGVTAAEMEAALGHPAATTHYVDTKDSVLKNWVIAQDYPFTFTFNVANSASPISSLEAAAFDLFIRDNGTDNAVFYKYELGNGSNTVPVSNVQIMGNIVSFNVEIEDTLYQHSFVVNDDDSISDITVNKLPFTASSANYVKLNSESYVTTGVTATGAIVSTRHRDSTTSPYVYDAYIRTATGNTMDAYERLAKESDLDGFATEQWVEDKAYITGITAGDVTDALGYTPADASKMPSTDNFLPLTGGTMSGHLTLGDASTTTYKKVEAMRNVDGTVQGAAFYVNSDGTSGFFHKKYTGTSAVNDAILKFDSAGMKFAAKENGNATDFKKVLTEDDLTAYASQNWTVSNFVRKADAFKIWSGTQEEYDEIGTYDNNTVYIITN